MTSPQWRYRAWGIEIASPFPVPDFAESHRQTIPDIEIRLGSPPQGSSAEMFTLPGGGRVHLLENDVAMVESDREAAELHPSLLRSLLAVVLRRRGCVALHAAAVEIDGRAIALAGASGSGKSTLAAALCAQGGRLITDELCAVSLGDSAATVAPGSRILSLHPDAFAMLGAPAAVRRRQGRMLVEAPRAGEPRPLASLYLLQWSETPNAGISRVTGATLAGSLLGARFQPEIGPAVDPALELATLSRLGALCPAFQLHRPMDQKLAETVESLRAHLHSNV